MSNVCSICMKRFDKHTLQEVKECSEKYDFLVIERTANTLCNSCGDQSDIVDTDGYYWCHACLQFYTEDK